MQEIIQDALELSVSITIFVIVEKFLRFNISTKLVIVDAAVFFQLAT